MPWYLYLAIKQLFPTGKRVSLFFVIAVCGVMLGVMLLVIVQSVMGGFGRIYRDKIIETNGHIRIESGEVMYDYENILNFLLMRKEVAATSPYAHGVVMLQHKNRPAFPAIRSIDINRENPVVPIAKYIILGGIYDLDDDSVLLSSSLAASIGATLHSIVEVYTPLIIDKLAEEEVLLPRELKVVGIYETGWEEFDSNTMIATLRLMQELYNLSNGVHGIAVRLNPGYDEEKVASIFREKILPPNELMTWLDMYAGLLWILKLEKNMQFFLLLFIVIVAAFAIANAQLLTVIRKTREIGLLGALGGQPHQLIACYCFQGLFIGVLGTIFGITIGLVALYFRNDIIYGFAKLTNSEDLLIKFYQFAELPVYYTCSDFLAISISALILTTLAALLPAWHAARMKPAEALRNE